jgi:hypothetical protein
MSPGLIRSSCVPGTFYLKICESLRFRLGIRCPILLKIRSYSAAKSRLKLGESSLSMKKRSVQNHARQDPTSNSRFCLANNKYKFSEQGKLENR